MSEDKLSRTKTLQRLQPNLSKQDSFAPGQKELIDFGRRVPSSTPTKTE